MKSRSVATLATIVTVMALAMLTGDAAHATDYKFHVGCADRNFVVHWATGVIDPGQEYLRVITGTKNPGCSIGDYNGARDAHLPVERHSDGGGIIQGIPGIGIICGIFKC